MAWLALLLACSDGPPARDAGTPAPADARVGSDGSPGVACDQANCAPGQTCCREVLVPGQASTYCLEDISWCEGATFTCDGPEDCGAAELCCADLAGRVACAPSCSGMVVCHTAADCGGTGCCDTPNGIVATCCGAAQDVRP
jgi:hypothetical protein